jgi:hypothetical protein
MHVVHKVEGVRADDAANEQIAEDWWQVEAAADDYCQYRGAEKQKGKGE